MSIKIFQKLAVVCSTLVLLIATTFPFGDEQIIARADSLPNIGISDISPEIPEDIPGGAANASLTDAAIFAWKEFIALNWPAVPQHGNPGERDRADTSKYFGENTRDKNPYIDRSRGSLVWETFRHKVEIFPAQQDSSYEPEPYDTLPTYKYFKGTSPEDDGDIPACTYAMSQYALPWVNLDENSEIGLAKMFAGENPGRSLAELFSLPQDFYNYYTQPEFLYLAKANRQEYDYVTNQGDYYVDWRKRWNGFTDTENRPPIQSTIDYIINNKDNAPPASADKVSFPTGTIEIKSAWRSLSKGGGLNDDWTHFHTAPVRFYVNDSRFCSVYDYLSAPDYSPSWGMAALHIIHKTPSAPYFTFATFSQEDNLRDTKGDPVEDGTGKYVGPQIDPLTPEITSTPADNLYSLQKLQPTQVSSAPGKSLYYDNTEAENSLPQGTVTVNKREVPIPQEIQDVNQAFHNAIRQYNSLHGISNSPWEHYKLVNVQYRPIDKKPGVEYDGTANTINGSDKPIDVGSYYLSNEVVESDYVLQKFSGSFQPKGFCRSRSSGQLTGEELANCLQPLKDNPNICQNLASEFGIDANQCQATGELKVGSRDFAGPITDFVNPDYQVSSDTNKQQFPDTAYKNVYHQERGFNMGGCIGCHGVAANSGTDFSFILSGGPGSSQDGLRPDAIDIRYGSSSIVGQEELLKLKPAIQSLIEGGGKKAPLSDNFTTFFGQ